MNESTKKDIKIISICSLISALLYILFEGKIMELGKDTTIPILTRFMPVLIIQFGMSCLGILIVLMKNKEKLSTYGIRKRNSLKSILGCFLCSMPTIIFFMVWNAF